MGKNNKEEYKAKDLVFGQLRGYPWWPAYIMNREGSGDYMVVFFGDFTYASLNTKKIRPFMANSRKFDKKNHKLTLAIKSALRVLRKETTIKMETEAVLKPVFKAPPVKSKRTNRKKKTKQSPNDNHGKKTADTARVKTKKIKKTESKVRAKRRVSGKSSAQRKKPKRNLKTQALELVNDTNERVDLESKVKRGNKMSMSLAIDEFKEELDIKIARSVRAKQPENLFFDDLIETKSMKPTGMVPEFGLESQGRVIKPRIETIFKAEDVQNESAIALINQTKNSMISLENMNEMILENKQNIGSQMNLLEDVVSQKISDKILQNDVIDLNYEKEDFEPMLKCPSVSSKAPFSLKQNDLYLPNSMQSLSLSGKANFAKVEREMQDLVLMMRKTQSVGQLEERLKQWHSELNMKPNFKFIVTTNIGKYLSNMKNFCNRRLNDTNHFDNVLRKIKDFEKIIMKRITTTFFGQEQKNLIHQIQDQISVGNNQSPASKDPTIFNQSFPSPHYKPKQEFMLGQSLRNSRRKSTLRQALLESQKHQQPSKRMQTRNSRKYTDNTIYFDNFDDVSPLKSSMADLDLTGKTFDTDKIHRNISNPVGLEKEMYCKVKKDTAQDFEDTSVLTMKRDNLDSKAKHWNFENIIDNDTQIRVAKKIGKKLFQIKDIPQMKCDTVLKLGKIIEETLRQNALGVEEYQREVLGLLDFIAKRGKDFYLKFLSQNQKRCDVHKLQVLLRERMRCN